MIRAPKQQCKKNQKKMKLKHASNYYQVLGFHSTTVSSSSSITKQAIRSSYLKLCKQYHPDTPNGCSDSFKLINVAYETLYDDGRRRIYDQEISSYRHATSTEHQQHQHQYQQYQQQHEGEQEEWYNEFKQYQKQYRQEYRQYYQQRQQNNNGGGSSRPIENDQWYQDYRESQKRYRNVFTMHAYEEKYSTNGSSTTQDATNSVTNQYVLRSLGVFFVLLAGVYMLKQYQQQHQTQQHKNDKSKVSSTWGLNEKMKKYI
jgi:DnaJ-class molecular chaperone